jgi:hypothetical protein
MFEKPHHGLGIEHLRPNPYFLFGEPPPSCAASYSSSSRRPVFFATRHPQPPSGRVSRQKLSNAISPCRPLIALPRRSGGVGAQSHRMNPDLQS